MNGKIKFEIGARPIPADQVNIVIIAVENKIQDLQAQFPNLQITASAFIWQQEVI